MLTWKRVETGKYVPEQVPAWTIQALVNGPFSGQFALTVKVGDDERILHRGTYDACARRAERAFSE